MRLRTLFFLAPCLVLLLGCQSDDEDPTTNPPVDPEQPGEESPVVFEPENLPYPTLSDYHFFEGDLKDMEPAEGVLPYELITPLFTDYAKKKRFIWMANGTKASYHDDYQVLNFEDGTVLIKNFYYDEVLPDIERRIIETRLLYKVSGAWHFAEYVWNEEQTEAHLDMGGSYLQIEWLHEGSSKSANYRIPSEGECLTCHKTGTDAIPLGPKPQNLDKSLAYADGVKNQLAKWAEVGYLDGSYPLSIDRMVAWDDASQPLELRLRSYLDVNCSSCHLEGSHCDYRPIRLAWNETADPVNMGLCIEPDEIINSALLYIVAAGNTARSTMHYRMASVEESERMPLLGRSIVHEEGLALLTEYINSLETPCP